MRSGRRRRATPPLRRPHERCHRARRACTGARCRGGGLLAPPAPDDSRRRDRPPRRTGRHRGIDPGSRFARPDAGGTRRDAAVRDPRGASRRVPRRRRDGLEPARRPRGVGGGPSRRGGSGFTQPGAARAARDAHGGELGRTRSRGAHRARRARRRRNDRAPPRSAARAGAGARPRLRGSHRTGPGARRTRRGSPVIVARTKRELHDSLEPARRAGRTIGLVPTMGYLHEGHLSLMRAARERCDVVVMSLFVNPAQFGPGEDLASYPRDEGRDLELAEGAGVSVVYTPEPDEVYPEGFATAVEVGGGFTDVLDGAPDQRGPGHFRGVTTVVAKLFNAVGPDVAYFGQKDAQQVAVIRRMVSDLDFPLRIEVLPTVREPDGLAMSSRNAYLEPSERQRATALSRALAVAEEVAPSAGLSAALEAADAELRAAGIEPEYLEARDAEDLSTVTELGSRPVLIALAAQVGGARLIDNVLIDP